MWNACRSIDKRRSSIQGTVGEPSDETLIHAVATGKHEAMRTLFLRHNAAIYRFAVRLTRDKSLAEEVVSEVFVELWRKADTFKYQSRVLTWLLGIARNKAFSALRAAPATQPENEANAVADTADDPEMAAIRNSDSAVLRHCLARLPAAHREIIDLVYYHERTIEEIATILGIPPGTVKSRMFHARQRTAELLKHAGVDRLEAYPATWRSRPDARRGASML